MRDVKLNATAYFNFAANQVSDGVPTDIASLAIAAYPNNSATQITAGITITNPDGLDGSYNVQVDATIANGYLPGVTYALKITVGTVGGVSVVGAVIGEFGIRVDALGLIRTQVLQSGSTSSTAKLDTGASSTDDNYNGATIAIVGGTGAGQAPRLIDDYTGSSRVCAVSPNWVATPDDTSVYEIYQTPPSSTAIFPDVNTRTITANAITATAIASDAITAAKIASDAITAAKIANDAITAVKIATGAITNAKFAAGAIDASAIASDAITAAKIASNAISAAKLAADAIAAIQSGLALQATLSAGISTITTQIGVNGAGLTAVGVGANGITAASFAASTEPGAVPGPTASIDEKIDFIFAALVNITTFNKNTGAWVLRNSTNTGNIGTRTDSNDGTTFTKGKDA